MYKPADSPLLNEVRRVIRLRHMSLATEKSYVHYILDFIYFHQKRHPQEFVVSWMIDLDRTELAIAF